MAADLHELKSRQSFDWIKSRKTGDSYLCPAGSIKNRKKASEKDLQRNCVNDSYNPQA